MIASPNIYPHLKTQKSKVRAANKKMTGKDQKLSEESKA